MSKRIREAFDDEEILINIELWMVPESRSSILKKNMSKILYEGFWHGYQSREPEIQTLEKEVMRLKEEYGRECREKDELKDTIERMYHNRYEPDKLDCNYKRYQKEMKG